MRSLNEADLFTEYYGHWRFEHFYQLSFWQLSGCHCHSQHISGWLSEAQGMAARHFATLPGGLVCFARSIVFAKGKSPHFTLPWSVRGLQVKKLLSLNARCKKQGERRRLKYCYNNFKASYKNFWTAEKKVLTVMLEIHPLALGLNLDRDFPEELTAFLVHADCPLQFPFLIFSSIFAFPCRKWTC